MSRVTEKDTIVDVLRTFDRQAQEIKLLKAALQQARSAIGAILADSLTEKLLWRIDVNSASALQWAFVRAESAIEVVEVGLEIPGDIK